MPNRDSKCNCCLCGEPLVYSKYYKSNSEFYKDGHLPICKECFGRKFRNYVTEYGSNKIAMKRMCMAFDIYFNEKLFDKCNTDDSTVLGNYFRMLNMSQNKGKTFDTTISEGFNLFDEKKSLAKEVKILSNSNTNNNKNSDNELISPVDIEKWGFGFEPIDYDILNNHEKLLINSNPEADSNASIFINDLCYIKMQQMKAVRDGRVDDYSKLTTQYIKTFTQAGLKTVKDTNVAEDFTIGINAETIEKYTPAEYYRNKNLYKDHDNIGDYISRFLFRPLRNLMQGTKDRDIEFYVKDDGDTDEYPEEF